MKFHNLSLFTVTLLTATILISACTGKPVLPSNAVIWSFGFAAFLCSWFMEEIAQP